MTQNPPRGSNSNLSQARPAPIAPLNSDTAAARPAKGSRANAQARQTEAQKQASDFLSDKATAAFVRRTLCAHNVLASGEKGRATPLPIDELLPPLTSSNDVDLQLYAIIAVIIKEFVYTWYSKITPDHVFVDEVIQIIAHCTRALEQRLRKVDLEAVLLDEIPELFEAHLTAYRISKQSSHHNPLAADPHQIYHTLRPHPALSPVPQESDPSSILEQLQNEAAWRQLLVQGVLAVLLPTEDLENGCLRVLVAEIFSEMILGGGISEKACEGWMLWELITKIAEVLDPRTASNHGSNEEDAETTRHSNASRLEQFGLLSSTTEAERGPIKPARSANRGVFSKAGLFWAVLQYAFLAFIAVRAVVVALATSSSLRARSMAGGNVPSPIENSSGSLHSRAEAAGLGIQPSKRPIVSMGVWSCASRLLELDARMPWLSGFVSLLHWGAVAGPGRVGDTDGVLDRLLHHQIATRALNPAQLPTTLRSLRAALFPNNAPAPPRVPPTAAQTAAIKLGCARSLQRAVPQAALARLLATQDEAEQTAQLEELLAVFEDSYLNKHLVFAIVELVVVRLLPEMAERGPAELMEERLG